MKRAIPIVAGLLIFVGAIWALQGIGILPGSVMSGERAWLLIGSVMIIFGVGMLVMQRRGASEETKEE